MAEYIECRNCSSPDCHGCNVYTLATMLNTGKFDCLMDGNRAIHFADVAPVVRGVWKTGFIDKQNKTTGVECSECNAYFELDLFDFGLCYKYCPNCGARMDGE